MIDWDGDPELKQLRAEFIASFDERARLFRSAGPEEARYLAHKLAGSAATYGFSAIGKLSGALDDWSSLGPSVSDPAILASYAGLLAEALEQAAKIGRDDPALLSDPRAKRLISEAEALVSGSKP